MLSPDHNRLNATDKRNSLPPKLITDMQRSTEVKNTPAAIG